MDATFFKKLFGYCEGGVIEVRALPSRARAFYPVEDIKGLETFCQRHVRNNLFFGTCTRNGEGGRKENVLEIPALWCDVDFKTTSRDRLIDLSKYFVFPPSATVISGGGVHFYWKLTEPATREDIPKVEDALRRIAKVLEGDFSACECARILRIPGSVNFKYQPPVRVKLTKFNDLEHELSDFLSELPETDIPSKDVSIKNFPKIEEIEQKLIQCDFLKWCRDNPQDVKEPLWFAMLSNLICVRPFGYTLCHEWSKGHPGYSRKKTDDKVHHVLDGFTHTCEFVHNNKDANRKCSIPCDLNCPVNVLNEFINNTEPNNEQRTIKMQIK